MELIQIELKKTRFMAYYFDGKEVSAQEFCRKWECNYITDFMDDSMTSIIFPDGTACYANNYIVIDGNSFQKYTPQTFMEAFNVMNDFRQRNTLFMSED
jgi:hypothetical protein